MKNSNTQVAEEILNQLGGNRFVAMTGSHSFAADTNSLRIKLRRNKISAQYLKIELNAMDTYEMTFFSVNSKTFKQTIKKEYNGIYNDQLQELFTDATGLYTKF